MSSKKVAGRTVAISSGVICVILAVGLISSIAYYTNVVNQKNTTFDYYVATHHHTDEDYDSLQSIASLGQQQYVLNQYTVFQGNATRTFVGSFQANYAGYLHIYLTSAISNAYLVVEYWYHNRLFSFQNTIGAEVGEAYFCVLPANVSIYAENTNLLGTWYTVTALYYY